MSNLTEEKKQFERLCSKGDMDALASYLDHLPKGNVISLKAYIETQKETFDLIVKFMEILLVIATLELTVLINTKGKLEGLEGFFLVVFVVSTVMISLFVAHRYFKPWRVNYMINYMENYYPYRKFNTSNRNSSRRKRGLTASSFFYFKERTNFK